MTLKKLAWPTNTPHTTAAHMSQENLGVYIKTQSTQTGKRRQESFEWDRVIGSLTSDTVTANLEQTRLLTYGVLSVFGF